MTSLTYTERKHDRPGQRWLYELSDEVRYDTGERTYSEGRLRTRFILVSWGRDGDTGIFPADADGRVLDYLGYRSWPNWVPASEAMAEWASISFGVPA